MLKKLLRKLFKKKKGVLIRGGRGNKVVGILKPNNKGVK